MHLEKGKNIEKLTAGNLAENYTYLAGKRSIKSIEKNGFKFKSDTKKAVEKALNEKFDSVEYHKVHWKQGESYFECIGFNGSVDSYEGRGGKRANAGAKKEDWSAEIKMFENTLAVLREGKFYSKGKILKRALDMSYRLSDEVDRVLDDKNCSFKIKEYDTYEDRKQLVYGVQESVLKTRENNIKSKLSKLIDKHAVEIKYMGLERGEKRAVEVTKEDFERFSGVRKEVIKAKKGEVGISVFFEDDGVMEQKFLTGRYSITEDVKETYYSQHTGYVNVWETYSFASIRHLANEDFNLFAIKDKMYNKIVKQVQRYMETQNNNMVKHLSTPIRVGEDAHNFKLKKLNEYDTFNLRVIANYLNVDVTNAQLAEWHTEIEFVKEPEDELAGAEYERDMEEEDVVEEYDDYFDVYAYAEQFLGEQESTEYEMMCFEQDMVEIKAMGYFK